MAARLTSLLPRVVALTAILVLGSATLTFAAGNPLSAAAPAEPAPAAPVLQTVPDVTGQAYVFAKGTLEEAGFAWRVVGGVQGYSANNVVSQRPAGGTRVVDTGAPTILLTLTPNGRYGQEGAPENASPYAGTRIQLPGAPKRAKPAKPQTRPKAKPKRKQKAKPAARPRSRPRPAAKPGAKPKAKLAQPRPAAKPKAKPKPKPQPKPKPRPKAQPTPQPQPAARPPAFAVTGAPAEPVDEMTLPQRARRLERWLSTHRRPTNANVRHWLYQHEWIVTGARFGWFGGEEALRILIRVDERVQRQWQIGAKSERVARSALAEVAAKSR